MLLTAVTAIQWPAPGAAAAPVALPITAALVRGDRTALVVDLSAGTRPGRPSVTVTRDGVPQQANLVPLVSDGLAVALVVDTSVAGAATLPTWQSAAARFILEAPPTTQAVVIADSAPAAVIAGPERGPSGTVRALTSVPARGARDTAAALRLAMRQFPAAALGRRLVVLYTTGTDARGEDAAGLGDTFRQSGTVLVVVGAASAGPYWATAAAATGGFFAPAGDPVVIPALDQVSTVLRSRYLVELPTPPTLPARLSVRVDTGDLTLTGDAIVAAPPSPAPAKDPGLTRTAVLLWIAVAGAAVLVAVAAYLRRRRPRPAAAEPPAPPAPLVAEPVARGHAAVPPPVVRGRATVHNDRPPDHP
ncbi:VWA domain-containing protein [Actinoplanes sp. NPDC049681]|uniref:VWA domain-containing protein n=1 Tax=Actinoplanes sp. NPDC049681 TaxID=3363905 RepID=UPI0037B97965